MKIVTELLVKPAAKKEEKLGLKQRTDKMMTRERHRRCDTTKDQDEEKGH